MAAKIKRLIQTYVSKNTPAPVSSRPKAAAAVKESFNRKVLVKGYKSGIK